VKHLSTLLDVRIALEAILKRISYCLILSLSAAPAILLAQGGPQGPSPIDQYAITSASPHTWTPPNYSPTPFSRLAIGGGISSMGGNMQVAVIANRYMNVRGVGNYFTYSLNNVSLDGLKASGTLNFATAGASVDFYPFPNHGFRISPGVLFYNQNQLTAAANAPGGTSFTLNGTTYYSANVNSVTGATPIAGNGLLGLNSTKPAFTATTGWGNMIPRSGRHLSFPFEIGAAFTGAPTVNVNLGGWACYDQAQTECASITGNSQLATAVQSNLSAQVAKWKNDLNPFRFYPIFTAGVAYSFNLRPGAEASPAARPLAQQLAH
jgi:hypothetical protein